MGSEVTFSTAIHGFNALNDIVDVQREFGDGTKSEPSDSLSTSHTFNTRGTKVVIQRIRLKNGMTLMNFITLYVVDTSLMTSYALQTTMEPLNPDSLKEVKYNSTVIPNYAVKKPIAFLNSYEPGLTEKPKTIQFPMK
jgi:hypothetical protein